MTREICRHCSRGHGETAGNSSRRFDATRAARGALIFQGGASSGTSGDGDAGGVYGLQCGGGFVSDLRGARCFFCAIERTKSTQDTLECLIGEFFVLRSLSCFLFVAIYII